MRRALQGARRAGVMVVSLLAIAATLPAQGPGSIDLATSTVHTRPFMLQRGQTLVVETRNATPGAVPVLHLLDDRQVQVAMAARNASGNQARLTYRAAWTPPGCRPERPRSCDPDNAPVSSRRFTLVVRPESPGANGEVDLLVSGTRAARVNMQVTFATFTQLERGERLVMLATPDSPRPFTTYVVTTGGALTVGQSMEADQRVMSAATATARVFVAGGTGSVRVIRNDLLPGRDADNDGLGRGLERAIGTCAQRDDVVGNWECSRSRVMDDTDGDGLSDGLEVLGARDLPLPRWGADPRHKDMFLEVDFLRASPNEPVPQAGIPWAKEIAAIFADDAEQNPVRRLLHAQTLGNPDLQTGITVHMDIGVDPPPGASRLERISYGNWGGSGVVAPRCDASKCERQDAATAYAGPDFASARRGVFRYAPRYPGSGGQCELRVPFCAIPGADAVTAVHELGHALGLNHHGDDERLKPGANCKANYPSLMNYADQTRGYRGWSDGRDRPPLNNARLREDRPMADPRTRIGQAYMERLRTVFGLFVDSAGRVDWNADGVMQAGDVRAWSNHDVNTSQSGGCEYSRMNQYHVTAKTTSSPAIVSHGNQLLTFYLEQGRIHVARFDRTLTCGTTVVECDTVAGKVIGAEWNTGIDAFDANVWVRGTTASILIVFRRRGSLFYSVAPTIQTFGPSTPIAGSISANSELSLTGPGTVVYLGYSSASGEAVWRRLEREWGPPLPMLAAGSPPQQRAIRVASGASLSLHAHDRPSGRTLLAAVPMQGLSGEQGIRLLTFDEPSGTWRPLPWQPVQEPVIGKPALTVTDVQPGSPLPWRIHLATVRPFGTHHVVRYTYLRVGSDPARTAGFRPFTNYDNAWLYGFGVDLAHAPGVDTNLRALIARRLDTDGVPRAGTLLLRMAADGVVDAELRDWDDYDTLGRRLCDTLRPRVRCAP